MAFLPDSVFPPVEIRPEAPEDSFSEEFPEEENILVMLLLSHSEKWYTDLMLENNVNWFQVMNITKCLSPQFEETVDLTF